MKKLILMLCLAIPMIGMSQTRKTTQEMDGRVPNETKTYFGEVLIIDQQGRQIIRVNFDGNTGSAVSDKELRIEMENLKKTSFESVLQAVNTASLLGWKIGESFTIETKQGKEIHILMSKELEKVDMGNIKIGGQDSKDAGSKVAPKPTGGTERKK
jgi:sporulation-control protein spo0M